MGPRKRKYPVPVHDGGSSDLSAQSYFPSQYWSSRTHPPPVDAHVNSDTRQHSVGPTHQINIDAAAVNAVAVFAEVIVVRPPYRSRRPKTRVVSGNKRAFSFRGFFF